MAINHNFKEGIDWAADSTGETPLAGHIFVSKSGNDSTGDGSPQNPYLTIAKGCSVAGVLIVGTGSYTVDDVFKEKITGDGFVIFKKGAGISGVQTNTAGLIKNIIFQNYDREAVYGTQPTNIHFCTFVDCIYGLNTGATGIQDTFFKCTFINSRTPDFPNILLQACLYDSCKFFNSRVISTFQGVVQNNYFDAQSPVLIGEFSAGQRVTFNNNCVNGPYTNTSTAQAENNIFNQNPFFNNVNGFDFSVTPSSPLIGAGLNNSNIGNVSIGSPYHQGIEKLDTPIDANANVAYDGLGQISIQAGAGDSVVIETLEEEALELSVLGAINLSGFPNLFNNTPDSDNTLVNPNNLILEINVAFLDGVYLGWKKYRWNERPTQNTDGTSNGESSYNWADNNKVRWKKRKFRVTILNDGIYNQA